MTDVTLTDGTITVTIYATKVDTDVSKDWKFNTIPVTASGWFSTTSTGTHAIGATTLNVTSGAGFKAQDMIYIDGLDGSSVQHRESATISSIATNALTLKSGLIYGYAAGARVIRSGRVISLDFNKIIESLTITGKIVASSTKDVFGVKNDLLALAIGGGSISVTYGTNGGYSESAITKVTLSETPFDTAIPTEYDVILNLTKSGKPIGET